MDFFLLVFIALISYILLLFVIKKSGLGKKKTHKSCSNACPDCHSPLNRIQRKISDHILHHASFKIFDARRYICNHCGWEGVRWEEHFKQKK